MSSKGIRLLILNGTVHGNREFANVITSGMLLWRAARGGGRLACIIQGGPNHSHNYPHNREAEGDLTAEEEAT